MTFTLRLGSAIPHWLKQCLEFDLCVTIALDLHRRKFQLLGNDVLLVP